MGTRINSWYGQNQLHNASARTSYLQTEASSSFRQGLSTLLTAGYAESEQVDLDVTGNVQKGNIFLLTHVDIIPPQREAGTKLLLDTVKQFRQVEGNSGFDLILQPARRNHITIVESWDSLEAYHAHSESDGFKAYRHALQPMMGSLYDERIYQKVDF